MLSLLSFACQSNERDLPKLGLVILQRLLEGLPRCALQLRVCKGAGASLPVVAPCRCRCSLSLLLVVAPRVIASSRPRPHPVLRLHLHCAYHPLSLSLQ
jgi:hypothetical protein